MAPVLVAGVPHGLTVEEFIVFAATRPNEERWELMEGEPVLNAAPTDWHQTIVTNVIVALASAKQELNANWLPITGIGSASTPSPPQ